jgi:hypothetical protein
LLWDLERERPAAARPSSPVNPTWRRLQPYAGAALLMGLLAWILVDPTPFTYSGITGRRGILVLFGLVLGLVNQRSRFCIVRAFREPFMTGEASMTKATALALAVGVAGYALIKGGDLSDLRNVNEFVNPSVWVGSLAGGILFGIGMVLAGGCGTGSLWRAAEGQVKLWVVLLVFSVTSALFGRFLAATGLRQTWRDAAYFVPDLLGWTGGLVLLLAVPAAWYAVAVWNEKREFFVVK